MILTEPPPSPSLSSSSSLSLSSSFLDSSSSFELVLKEHRLHVNRIQKFNYSETKRKGEEEDKREREKKKGWELIEFERLERILGQTSDLGERGLSGLKYLEIFRVDNCNLFWGKRSKREIFVFICLIILGFFFLFIIYYLFYFLFLILEKSIILKKKNVFLFSFFFFLFSFFFFFLGKCLFGIFGLRILHTGFAQRGCVLLKVFCLFFVFF